MRDFCLLRFSIRSALLLLSALCCAGCGDRVIPPVAPQPWVSSLTLVDQSTNVNMVQGYASGTSLDGTPLNFFFSNSLLYSSSTYDSLTPVAVNQNLLPPKTNHLGAGDYYDGHVYGVIENWQGCDQSSAPIFVAIFDAATLQQESTVEITAWIPEASGIAIIPGTGQALVSSFCDPNHLYLFSTADWSFTGTVPLQIPVSGNQGVSYRDGFVYIAGTNGALYGLHLADNSMRLLMQSPVSGEFEGLDFHGPQLRWLVNRSDGPHILYSYAPVYAAASTP